VTDQLERIAVVGNYIPRQCGIATFTSDLAESLAQARPDSDIFAVAMNDREEGYPYPPRVHFEVEDSEVASYRRAADFLNIKDADIVCLQHEYGIFGGAAGRHILSLLSDLRMPIVTTFHTVLEEPDPDQKKVLKKVAQISSRVVVMAERAVGYLKDIYGVPEEKIDFIHHGIPDVPFVDPNFHKDNFGVEGRMVLLTFGLLSPNKGIEYAIQALPAIVKRFPNVVYIVLGATHPHLVRSQGETYRLSLQRTAKELGVEGSVLFHNRFVSLEELVKYISAADLYVTPYLNPAQMVSGTLAYSVGAGKAVVSTPIWYAQEILADGRGLLIPARDPEALAQSVIELLENDIERHAMRKRAYMLGREMIWSEVANRYLESFERAREQRRLSPRVPSRAKTLDKDPKELPPLKLDHLYRMTDGTGIFQHALYTVPNFDHGYCSDDNARALIFAELLESERVKELSQRPDLATTYLAFLHHAYNPETKRFRNFMSYDRRWLEEAGSEDSQGRVFWALGTVVGRSKRMGRRNLAGELFVEALPIAKDFESPRACAFTLVGIHEYLRSFYGDSLAQELRVQLAEKLLALYRLLRKGEWRWFEEGLTYANAKLPHALLLSGRWLEHQEMFEAGLESLEWLCGIQRGEAGQFVPIGSNGFYRKGGERARFDQQPIEAHSTVSACIEAYRVTGEDRWLAEASRAFDWFLGGNDLRLMVYDPSTGGCHDGLQQNSVNQNQGAESTLAFMQSLLEMTLIQYESSDSSEDSNE
jgi:glycosyltransferase involved in cell wall biosynthesis